MIGLIMSLAGAILPKLFNVVDKAVVDKDKANELKHELQTAMLSVQEKELDAAASVIRAEANSESAAARNWRPHLMYLIMFLIVFNGVVVPLLHSFTGIWVPTLQAWNAIPPQMWTLLQIGLGGYVAGRSLEKIAGRVGPALAGRGQPAPTQAQDIQWNQPRPPA